MKVKTVPSVFIAIQVVFILVQGRSGKYRNVFIEVNGLKTIIIEFPTKY